MANSVRDRFEHSKLEFDHKNFHKTIELLTPLLEPTIQLTNEEDIVKAREILGLAKFYTGDTQGAQAEFTQLLYLRPRHRLDPFLIPPAAVQLFNQIWNDPEIKEKLEKLEKERNLMDSKESSFPLPNTLIHRIYLERTQVERNRLITFFPFGLGQFQNDQTTKGILLASGGGLTLATNVISYGLLLALANDSGRYDRDDIALAKALKITQYVSLGIFAASWIYGIVDANLYFEAETTTPYRRLREENELKEAEVGSFFFLPDPAGLGLSLIGFF